MSYDLISCKSQSEFKVYIDNVEATDVILNSITVHHQVDTDSYGNFTLARKHDKLDYTLSNLNRPILNNQEVRIEFDGVILFQGDIEKIDADSSSETVKITAKDYVSDLEEEKRYRYVNIVNLPIPSITERLHPYHVLLNNISIYNPVIATDEELRLTEDYDYWYNTKGLSDYDALVKVRRTPPVYKGIRVNLGTEEKENIIRQYLDTYFTGNEFVTKTFDQNWTYFFRVCVTNAITGATTIGAYIGTSLISVGSDVLYFPPDSAAAIWHRQRIYDNTKTELGYYTVGTSPFKEISCANGRFISAYKYEDREDGMYSVKGESYDNVNYAKKIAQIEYKKLLSIDETTILPQTSATLELTLDGYLYYPIRLLTKVNIVNTAQADIYNNSNGFPLSIKTIDINASTMKVSIQADNKKSDFELQQLDEEYPLEPAKIEESSYLMFRKYDLAKEEYIN